jgi:hypothetical protein
MEKKSKDIPSVIGDIDAMVRSVQATLDCLSYDAKRIKPCVEALQNTPVQGSDSAANATKDLVNRLTVADEKLAEAVYLIGDALSSLAIGSKNYKESV